MTTDRLRFALDALDPGDRALLELSLGRGVSDTDIAELLGTDPDEIARRREGIVERIAEELDTGPEQARDELAAEFGAGRPAPDAVDAAVEEPLPTAEDAVPPAAAADRAGAPWGVIAACLAVVAVGIGIAVLLASDDDKDEPQERSEPRGAAPSGGGSEGEGKRRAVRFERLGSSGAGTVRTRGRTGDRLKIDVSGLPEPGGSTYQVWLYDSIADAVPLGQFRGGASERELHLPEDAAGHRFIDISLEPPDGNPNHGGASVLRAPTGRLGGR